MDDETEVNGADVESLPPKSPINIFNFWETK